MPVYSGQTTTSLGFAGSFVVVVDVSITALCDPGQSGEPYSFHNHDILELGKADIYRPASGGRGPVRCDN